MTDDEREFYMRRRQALIMELGALEELLGLPRSIVPKRKRGTVIETGDYVNAAIFGRTDVGIQSTCADCMRGDCEKARQGIEHT